MSKPKKLYADRNTDELDSKGDYYFKHVMAMTGEKLHSKSAIAAELGYRDMLLGESEQKHKQALLDLCDDIYNYVQAAGEPDDKGLLEYIELQRQRISDG